MDISMKEEDVRNLNKLFRDHGDILGTSGTTIVAIDAFIASIKALKCHPKALKTLVDELTLAVKNTEPHIPPLIHLLEQFEEEMEGRYEGDLTAMKQAIVDALTAKREIYQDRFRRVVEHGKQKVADGDHIIVYSTSSAVRNILLESKAEGTQFEVLILKQDFSKTRKLIWTVSGAHINHQVIPEYNLSNFVSKANKFFMGAIAVTSDRQVICQLGTAEIVSLCHLKSVPVYMFANSLKFSHQHSCEQRIHEKEESHVNGDCRYRMTIHSHCILDLDLVDHIVTEDGVVGHDAIDNYWQTRRGIAPIPVA
jgi:translation initiation factor 2B subunit (eIF-2B alpha/beta/delta family)